MRLSKIKQEPKKKNVALQLHPLCLSGWELVPCICLRLYTGQTDYQLLLAKLCYSSAVWFVNPSVNTKKVVVPLAGKWFKRCNKFPIATQWVMGSSQCTEECITSLWSVDCWTHTKICYRFQCYNLSVVFHLSFSWNKYIKTRWCLALWNNFIAPQHFPWWKLATRSLPALPARGEAGRKRRRSTGCKRCHGNITFSKSFPGPVMNWIRPRPELSTSSVCKYVRRSRSDLITKLRLVSPLQRQHGRLRHATVR